jgi:hypothetical protein
VTGEPSTPLTADAIERLNDLAHRQSEKFIVRMYAVMEAHKLVGAGVDID